MAQLTIHWTETAIRQRNYIFEYWIERNQSTTYAKKLNEKIKERTNLLKKNPDLGKKTDFKNTRAVSLGHYSTLSIGPDLYIDSAKTKKLVQGDYPIVMDGDYFKYTIDYVEM